MNIRIACEFSAVMREAFRAKGHDAWSCNLEQTEGRYANHLHGDVRWAIEGRLNKFDAVDARTGNKPLFKKWDMMIAHPPCTYLCNSGVRWMYRNGRESDGPDFERKQQFRDAAHFFVQLKQADIPRIAIENPIPHRYAKEWIGAYTQVIQPWQFGHGETKATCLWLKNLPPLVPTKIVEGRTPRVHHVSPGPDRWKERSRTLPGIAAAMAEQWGRLSCT